MKHPLEIWTGFREKLSDADFEAAALDHAKIREKLMNVLADIEAGKISGEAEVYARGTFCNEMYALHQKYGIHWKGC